MELPESERQSSSDPELASAAEMARAKLQAIRETRQTDAAAVSYPAALEAAAVVSRYNTSTLVEITGADDLELVLCESIPVAAPGSEDDWAVLPEVRGAILHHLSATKRLEEALAISKPLAPLHDPLRSALVKIDGEGPRAFLAMDVAELSSITPYVEQLEQPGRGFPKREQLDRRLELLRLLEPFDRLAGPDFQGRQSELGQLRVYVDVLESEGLLESLQRAFASEQKKPMLIYGVGGVGKSTLLAKFLVDHARAAESARFPFAYLDFDRRAVMVDEPASVLVEAVRQIGLQFDHAHEAAEELRRSWRALLAGSARRAHATQRVDSGARESIRRDFVGFVRKLGVEEGLPVLLVLDTFEEVQYRNRVYVESFGKFFSDLAADIPRLRVVFMGRADVPEIAFDRTIELGEFAQADAVAFLAKNGIGDKSLAETIVKLVGGNPLTLRLAAAVFRKEEDPSFKLALAKGETIQGQLFKRILQHVHDPDVQKIAMPGLVVRRVTPDIIREVLAGPCQLDVPTPERAQELFEELKREVSLVSPGSEPGVLQHRADVRRLMLPGLRDAEPDRAKEIHHAAVKYYQRFDDPVSRAEEIYHLLSLEELAKAKERFRPDVAHLLYNAMDELRAPEKALLADLLGRDIPPSARATATLEMWERAAILRVDEYVRHGQHELALKVFAEKEERSTSTLLRVREAAIHAEMLNFETASAILTKALADYTQAGNTSAIFETLLETAHVAMFLGDPAGAAAALEKAEALADAQNEDIWLLRVLTDPARGEIDATTMERIRETAHRLPDHQWAHDSAVLRRVAAVVGASDVKLVAKASSIAGGYALRAEDERKLSEALASVPSGSLLGGALTIWRRVDQAMLTADEPTRAALAAAIAEVFANEVRLSEPPSAQKPPRNGPAVKADPAEMARLLEDAGIDTLRLGDVLVRRFDRNLVSITFEKELRAALTEVLAFAQREGWLASLLDALRLLAPRPEALLTALDQLGIGVRVEYVGGPAMREAALVEQRQKHRTAIAFIEQRICRIETKAKFRGTGFLIAPALVLTAAPVVEPRDSEITVRFDYGAIGGKPYNEGVWCNASVTALGDSGLRLLRLQRPVGDEPVGGSRASRIAPVRRILDLVGAPRLGAKSPLFWFWHSEKDALHMTGTTEVTIGDEDLAMYSNDRTRFAGGPCFDEDFRLVAVHCGEHAVRRREGKALPVAKVVELIRAAGIELHGKRRPLRLTGPELRELQDVAAQWFSSDDLFTLLPEALSIVAVGQPVRRVLYELFHHFNRMGMLGDLIETLANARPNVPALDILRRRHLGR